jgi:DNA-binding LacI/PurR family transcriptional regulator
MMDINARAMKPGDPYLSTAEIARKYRVSGTIANRALQLLTQRGVLDRKQRLGTFIANPSGASESFGGIRKVHLIVQESYIRTEGLLTDGLLLGMQGAIPTAQFEFNFLPGSDEAAFVSGLITKVLRNREPEGFVLFRASIEAQRLVQTSGLPTVVCGSLHPSVKGLAHIDRDQRQAGVLLAKYLVDQGSQRIVMFFRDRISPGDHQLLDGALTQLHQSGLGLDDLVIRCLPADPLAIQTVACELLTSSDRQAGFLCRSTPLADGVAAAASAILSHQQPAICVADVYQKNAGACSYAHVRSTLTPEEAGAEIGRMLLAQVKSSGSLCGCRSIPVELVLPRPKKGTDPA